MSEEDIRDPRVGRWLEAGISGVPREREWDVVTVVAVPELEDSPLAEVEFRGFQEETLFDVGGDAPVAGLDRLVKAVEGELSPPYEGRAVRRDRQEWSVAARTREVELIDLPELVGVAGISVAIAPDGERTVYVESEEAVPEQVEAAAAELERRGRERFDAFAAEASPAGSRWELTIAPL